MRPLILVVGLLAATLTWGEQSTNSSGEYSMDLGQVYGAIQGIKSTNEICNESFPLLKKQNDAAFQNWRKQYLPFLQEIEKYWTAAAWKITNGDQQKYLEFLTKFNASSVQYKNSLRAYLSANGSDSLSKQCSYYSEYLTTERANFEYYYAEQVNTIRGGLVKHSTS
ncbi:MAG: hypothetical protein H7Z73_04545 [Candidatus Saccharibacteria bacterium]|nr:hypothetical protein [Moraxellaceae bacterium]